MFPSSLPSLSSQFISRVIALGMDGTELWISDPLEGIAQGDPQISSDGGYVFLTHNEFDASNSTGHFTILEANVGEVFYTGATADNRAFGPPGIYHMPIEGNYDPLVSGAPVSEGENNRNDFLMWSQTPNPSDVTIANGYLYGFQFPRDFTGNTSGVAFFELGTEEVDFQSTTPPVITDEGLSAYWGVSRSSFRGWTDKRFSRARSVAVGFERNIDFAGEAVFAPPALSNNGSDPIIFGGSASTQFIRMTADFATTVVVTTESYVYSKAHVDGQERAVYYVESNGNLHQADFVSLTDIWNYTVNFAVEGEMALTPNNDLLIIADKRGVITALEVAEILATEPPSAFPSDMPSMAPSGVGEPAAPVGSPVASGAPVAGSTSSPSSSTGGAPAPSAANQPMLFVAFVMSIAYLFV